MTLMAPQGLSAQTSSQQTSRIDGENRLFVRFVEDAAVVPSYWLEGQVGYRSNEAPFGSGTGAAAEADILQVGPVFAFNVAEDFEFGARVSLAGRDADDAGSDTGVTDLDLWGKVSIVTEPLKIALGVLLTAPTGDEQDLLGTGETDVEFFSAARKDFEHITLAGNVGLRINQDPDFDGLDLEGKNSLLLGAALLFPTTERLALTLEWALETERFDGRKNDARVLGGFDLRTNESLLFRGALGAGTSDGAPDLQLQASAVWLF